MKYKLNKEEQLNHSLFNDTNFIKRILNNIPIEMREFLDEIKPKGLDKIALSQQLNHILEDMIKRNPNQWIWTHDRWK